MESWFNGKKMFCPRRKLCLLGKTGAPAKKLLFERFSNSHFSETTRSMPSGKNSRRILNLLKQDSTGTTSVFYHCYRVLIVRKFNEILNLLIQLEKSFFLSQETLTTGKNRRTSQKKSIWKKYFNLKFSVTHSSQNLQARCLQSETHTGS